MRIAQPVRFGAWIVIILNLFMAIISIWVLMRISPAIELILARNDRSLQACEEMLTALSLSRDSSSQHDSLQVVFAKNLSDAEQNITEKNEPETLRMIKSHYKKAFVGDQISYRQTIQSIQELSKINRTAMVRSESEARRFSTAGAWIIVMMSILIFVAGLMLTRSLARNVIEPMEEIIAVVTAHKQGERQRRCAMGDYPTDIRLLFVEINTFLDDHTRPSELGFIYGESPLIPKKK